MTSDSHIKLMLMFSDQGFLGYAGIGSACETSTGRQFNINLQLQVEDWKAAEIYAHELGHNLGMQ